MRFFMPLLGGLAMVAACNATPQPPVKTLTDSCRAYTNTLNVLTAARAQGRLSHAQIATVEETNTVALTLCAAPNPPTSAQSAIDELNRRLEEIIFAQ